MDSATGLDTALYLLRDRIPRTRNFKAGAKGPRVWAQRAIPLAASRDGTLTISNAGCLYQSRLSRRNRSENRPGYAAPAVLGLVR